MFFFYARWKEAEEFISKHGAIVKTPSGYWQQVPQVAIAHKYLSTTLDLTAFVLVFPSRNDTEKYIILPYFWIPEDSLSNQH